ncbi:MAG: hypothetical protein NVS1B4_07710 [Gemmatimonadaceae bacterium]
MTDPMTARGMCSSFCEQLMNLRPRSPWRRRAAFLPLLAVSVLGGCDRVLKVTEPDVVVTDIAGTAVGASSLYAGAVSEFIQANDGNGNSNRFDGLAMLTGLLTDEFKVSDTFIERIEIDARSITEANPLVTDQYRRLMRASVGARRARTYVARYLPSDSAKLSRLSALAGFTEVLAAEHFCDGVPFSNVTADGKVSLAGSLSRAQTLVRAVAHFDSALATSKSAADANLARVGKGRALLDAGDFAGAALAVAAVPVTFVYANQHNASAGDPVTYLGVYTQNPDVKRYSIADSAGGGTNQIDWRNDPRVPIDSLTSKGVRLVGLVNNPPFWKLRRYFLTQAASDTLYRDTSLPFATGVEAELIKAEADLQAANVGAWIARLNALRVQYGLAGTLVDPGVAQDQYRLHFRERALWLFATGHRLGDLRRMVRQYGFTQDQVFPIGATTRAGQNYGTDVNLPIPQEERNNPNFKGCLNRGA